MLWSTSVLQKLVRCHDSIKTSEFPVTKFCKVCLHNVESNTWNALPYLKKLLHCMNIKFV